MGSCKEEEKLGEFSSSMNQEDHDRSNRQTVRKSTQQKLQSKKLRKEESKNEKKKKTQVIARK
jgi:hypothetical protein